MDIDSLSRPEVPENQIPILEQYRGSESDTEQASRESRDRTARKPYEAAEEKRLNDERKKCVGLRRAEADKKLRSILFLALGDEANRVFSQTNPRVKTLSISFKELT